MSNAIIKATAATAAAATLLGVGVTPAFADQTAAPDGNQGQNQTQPTARERLAAAVKAADAKAAQDRDWDETSKAAFDKAYADAKAVADDADDRTASTAASALETATANLRSTAEKALDDARARAKALEKDDYTADSWRSLRDALDDADGLKATDDRDGDADRQAKADAITAAIGGLDLQARADLADAITAAKAKRDNGRAWTTDTRSVLDDILEQAGKLADESHDKDALASMRDSVDKAARNLESQSHADLEKAIARYKALDRSRFTEDEREALQIAYGSARLADKQADDAEYDTMRADAAHDLDAAIDALDYPAVERLDRAVKAADEKAAQDRDWDKDSKAAFDKAYEDARGPFDDTKAGDAERVKAAAALEDATKALTTTQRVALKDAVREARGIDAGRLTAESANALKDAIDAADADLSDDRDGDDRAAALTQGIETARKGLKSTAQDGLERAIARCDEAEGSNRHWTKTSWGAVREPYNDARKTAGEDDIAANDDAKRAAAKALEAALDGLTTVEQEAYDKAVAAASRRADDDKYTAESRDALRNVLDGNGNLGKATDKAGDERLAAATEAIDRAVAATVRVSRDNLDRAIAAAQAKEAQGRDWTDDSKAAFDKALDAADKAAADADDKTLDSLADGLRDATGSLTTTQRADYARAVRAAEAMTEDDQYTADWIRDLKATLQSQSETVKGAGDDKAGDDIYARAAKAIDDAVSKPSYNIEQSLSAAIESAERQDGRGLGYSGDAAGLKDAFDKALKAAKDAGTKSRAEQDRARDALNQAQAALVGQSDEERAYKASADKAAGLTRDAYDDFGAVEALLGYDMSGRTGDEIKARTAAIDAAVKDLKANRWTVGGQALAYRDGKWTAGSPVGLDSKPDGVQAVGPDGLKVDLAPGDETFTQDGETLGVGHNSGRLSGSGHNARFDVAYAYKAGSKTTVKEAPAAEFRLRDGRWTAAVHTRTLGVDGNGKALDDLTEAGDLSDVELSDGTRLVHGAVSAVRETPNPEKPGLTVLSRDVEYAGRTRAGADVSVTVTYTATWGQTIDDLGLSYRLPGADAVPVTVAGLPTTVDGLPSSITLPAQPTTLKDAEWSISPKTTGDVRFDLSSPSVQADGTRMYRVTIHYYRKAGGSYRAATKVVRVTIPFRQAKRVVGNDKAALRGFTVNGRAMDGYSKDVVDYTIHAGADERVLVTPVPEAGQDVRAGDSRQTAYTTTQWWTVSKDGESRTYSVTLVRDHTTPTAAEAFKPAEPSGSQTKDANPSAGNTALKSVGYTLKGVYHPADGARLVVPEGGTLAYEYYEGQTVDVSSTRTGGMTWDYSLGVLSADGSKYEVHDVAVTYLTAATHRAELTGIKADGRLVSGFDPKRLEYTVKVGNADRYVITPVFDKTTGMSVTVHKDGRTVTLTATSADGLVRTVYTVHVVEDRALAALSSTGAGLGVAAPIAALLALLGIGVGVASRRREM